MSDPTPTSAPLAASDPHDIGHYRLVGRLGSGGMGVVFLALSPTGRYVAVKRIRPELGDDPIFQARFRREVEAGRSVMGACVIRYLDADIDGDPPFLVTEYVDGPNLERALGQTGPMSSKNLRIFAIGLAEAIESLHRAGVTHRDLKPSNVLLAGDTPKVIDYGVSSAVEATAFTQSGMLVGSPAWMAPEQALGRSITPAVDVFSWAALVAYAGTGRPPFGEGRPEAVLFRIVHGAPDLDGLDPDLRPLVEAGLAKDPAARPGPTELIRRLAAIPLPRSTTPSRGETTMTLAAALAPPPPPPPAAGAAQPPPPPAPRSPASHQYTPIPDPAPDQGPGRGGKWLLACLLVISLTGITAVLAAYNNWGPFHAPARTPGIASGQPTVNPSSTTTSNTAAPQSAAPAFIAAAFQSPAFLLVKAVPASQVVSNVLALTLDCPLANPGDGEVTTSQGDLPVTYNCAGGSFSFGTMVSLIGEPVIEPNDSATILAGSQVVTGGTPPAGVEADQGTNGTTWWVMSVGIIGASDLQSNDSQCTAASEPSECIATLFTTAPHGTHMEATQPFDRQYVQDLTYMFVQGYSLVPEDSWGSQRDLHVLIGQTISTAQGLAERAYFFVEDVGEVGIDSSVDSEAIRFVAHNTINEVTLRYSLYDPGDTTAVSSADVRFEWTGGTPGKFVTLGALPPSSSSVNGSRL